MDTAEQVSLIRQVSGFSRVRRNIPSARAGNPRLCQENPFGIIQLATKSFQRFENLESLVLTMRSVNDHNDHTLHHFYPGNSEEGI